MAVSKQFLWMSITLAGSIVAILALVYVFSIYQSWLRGRDFDPVVWRDEIQIQKGVRLEMADRLIARDALRNMTRAEVVDLLGDPPATEYFRDWDLVYWLGNERTFISIDSEWLVVRLDGKGRVAEYRVVRD